MGRPHCEALLSSNLDDLIESCHSRACDLRLESVPIAVLSIVALTTANAGHESVCGAC